MTEKTFYKDYLGIQRPLKEDEKALIHMLLKMGKKCMAKYALNSLEVQEMNDEGMGSLYIISPTKKWEDRKFGKRIADVQYNDTDGIPILVSLNVDTDGDLFELDIWKINYSPVVSLKGFRNLETK